MPAHTRQETHQESLRPVPPEVEQFFNTTAPVAPGYRDHTFSYLAIRSEHQFLLLQGTLLFGSRTTPLTHFHSENVRAGCYRLKEDLELNPRTLIEKLLSGALDTPHGELEFPCRPGGKHAVAHLDLHPTGLQHQMRLNVLTISGASLGSCLKQPSLDWEVKASATPYDGLQELASEYGLGLLRGEVATVEAVAHAVVVVDSRSRVEGRKALMAVRAAKALSPDKIRIGYRVFGQGRCCERSAINGGTLKWTEEHGIKIAEAETEVPEGAVVNCITSYDGSAQHHWWIFDPSKAQNPRRAAYETIDPGLKILRENLNKTGRGRDQDDFESGVAVLLWMLGFSPAHVGRDKRLESADQIATTPQGHFAVVECTTGLLKADTKMARVIERAERVRSELGPLGSRVLPVMVTPKFRADVRADVDDAEKHGVLVIAREQLDEALDIRTVQLPNADLIYAEAEQAVRNARARHEAEPEVNLDG
jgi:hypothetical protein